MPRFGIYFPFSRTSEDGYFRSSKNLLEVAKSNILSLIVTDKTERLIHSDMGCDLHRKVFDQLTPIMIRNIKENIKSQVNRWLPYINIDEIQMNRSERGHGIHIHLRFSLKNLDNAYDTVDMNFE